MELFEFDNFTFCIYILHFDLPAGRQGFDF